MSLVFVDRSPTEAEVEKLRLILSTYQDGTGMLADEDKTLPGWRDFERSVAICFNGIALESKAIYDVLLHHPGYKKVYYGISCKMRQELREVDRNGRITLELSNAAKEFWRLLGREGINQQNYHETPDLVGKILIECIENWHYLVDIKNGGFVDTSKSIYLTLQYERKTGNYQLFQLPVLFPKPETIDWVAKGARVIGSKSGRVIFEWYGASGAQLKYYPHLSESIWSSEKFKLEPIPENIGSGILNKVIAYFPYKWEAIKDVK